MRKSAISPIGKWEIKKNKAETVNAEHVQTFFFFFFHSLRVIGTLHVSGFTQKQLIMSLGVKNDHLLYFNLSMKCRYYFFGEVCSGVEGAKVFNYEDSQGTELLNQLFMWQSPM